MSASPDAASSGGHSSDGDGHHSDGDHAGSNKFNAGLVVGIVLALVISIGIGAAIWLVMRRRKRRRASGVIVDEKSSFNDDSDNVFVSFYWKVVGQVRYLSETFTARFQRMPDDNDRQPSWTMADKARQLRERTAGTFNRDRSVDNDGQQPSGLSERLRDVRQLIMGKVKRRDSGVDQAAGSQFSEAAMSSSRQPPGAGKLKRITTSFSVTLRKNARPISDDNTDHKDWLSTLSSKGKLFIANPSPPTPNSADPFSDPVEASSAQTKDGDAAAISRGRASMNPQNFSRPRSSSLSKAIKDAMRTDIPAVPQRPESSYNQKLENPKHSRSSTDGSVNPFANRGPSFYPPTTGPLPTFDDITNMNPFADPMPALPAAAKLATMQGHRRADTVDTSGSSVVLLPAADKGSFNFLDANSRSSSRNGERMSNASGAPPSLRSGRASSHIFAGDTDAAGRGSTVSSVRASKADQPIKAGQINNTMAWKFPAKTPDGGSYKDLVEPFKKASGKGKRDTTWTTRSDPFDLEGRLI